MPKECIALSTDETLLFRFLLASLQLQHVLRAKGDDNMREALNELPSTPDEAFENILRRIEDQERHSATTGIRTLTWCYYSRRPLKMEELCQALVVEDGCSSMKSNVKVLPALLILA